MLLKIWMILACVAAIDVPLLTAEVTKGSQDTSKTKAAMETNLLKDLFANYDKRVLPQVNESQPVTLSLGIKLLNIVELLEHEQVLHAYFDMPLMWSDFRLAWEPSGYQKIHVIHLPVEDLWQPDISILNNAQVNFEKMDTLALVFSSGFVYYSPGVRTKSTCEMDMTKFPRDQQTCTINLGSFTYDGLRINITHFSGYDNMDLSEYIANKEWTLSDTSASVITKKYECCQETYQYIQFNLKLKRNPVYYVHVFVLPAVIIAFLVPFQFLLPPDSSERFTFGSILLLGCVLLIFMIQTFMPQAHPNLPYIVQYYSLTMVWIALSIIYSIWIQTKQSRSHKKTKVPNIIRQVFLRALRKLVCLKEEQYYPVDEHESIAFRSLENQVLSSHSELSQSEANKLEKNVDEIMANVRSLLMRLATRSDERSEWYQVIVILDRIMILMFMLIFIVYTCVLFS